MDSRLMLPLFFSVVILFISFLNFSDSKSTRSINLTKRRVGISESLCDELTSLVLKLLRSIVRVQESIKESWGHRSPDYKSQIRQYTGVDISDETQVREFVCKVAGAESLTDITELLPMQYQIPQEQLAPSYNRTVKKVELVITEVGFDSIRKSLDLKEYMQNNALLHDYIQRTQNSDEQSGAWRYYGFEVLEELRNVLTLADMEDLITDIVKKFGNDVPRLFDIAAVGCFPPYCVPSGFIVNENRIGCIADAFMFSKNLSDFGMRLGISEPQADRIMYNIKSMINPFPDGAVAFYRSLADLVEFTYEEIPKLYHLTEDNYEYEYRLGEDVYLDDEYYEYYYEDADAEPEGDDD